MQLNNGSATDCPIFGLLFIVYPLYQPQEWLNSHEYLWQITPLYGEDMVDTGGHLGCYLHVQLTCIAKSMWKYIFFVCSDSIPIPVWENVLQPDIHKKVLNAKESFHAHQVSTRTLC